MELKSALAGISYYRRIYVDVSLDDIFNLRKEVASYVIDRKLEDEEIKGLELGRGINGLGYSSMNERHGKFEFFRHLGIENSGNYTNSPEFSNGQFLKNGNTINRIVHNGRRGSIAYFAKSGEVHIELDNF